MVSKDFLTALAAGPMVFDGAMGTLLYETGWFINHAFDEANLKKPESVLAAHESYVAVGADIVESNTFSANRYLLGRYGVEDLVGEINRAGVRLARQASGNTVYVAGALGPTGEAFGRFSKEKAKEIRLAFDEQISALADESPDLLVLETFHHLKEIQIALQAAKEIFTGPVVAQMSFLADGALRDGSEPELVAERLAAWGADVVGVNCALGPQEVFEIVQRMIAVGVPTSAQPNAGQPRRLDQRMLYMATPEYFGVYAKRFFKAGVRLVGGCCGTNPEHIAAVRGACAMARGAEDKRPTTGEFRIQTLEEPGLEPLPVAERSPFARKVRRVWAERLDPNGPRRAVKGPDGFVVSVEVNPHPGLTTHRAVEGARLLRDAGVDIVNIADGPRALVRMANWALGLTIKKALGLDFLLHVCCRDRNILGLQSDLLGVHVLGVRNVVVITGDPPKMGDYPKATAVFDLDSVELLKLIDALNHGIDPAGKFVGEATSFFCACGAEPAALDYDRELRRLEAKVANGAELIMTQPVYDPVVLERFMNDVAGFQVPVMVGLLPLASRKNAEFLHNEVPGMQIPSDIRERMARAGSGPAAQQEGVRIASEMLESVKDRVVGTYLMPPFSRYQAALDVLKVVGYGS